MAAVAVYSKDISVHRDLGAFSPDAGHGGAAGSPGFLRPAFSYFGDGRMVPAVVYSKIILCGCDEGESPVATARLAAGAAGPAAPPPNLDAGTLRGRDEWRWWWCGQGGRHKWHSATGRRVWCHQGSGSTARRTATRVKTEAPACRRLGGARGPRHPGLPALRR